MLVLLNFIDFYLFLTLLLIILLGIVFFFTHCN